MKLVVFDIDGTLTLGDGLGTRCFFEAFETAFGSFGLSRRLDSYRESTDGGIAREVLETALRRAPTDEEMERVKEAYLQLLAQEIGRTPRAYRPVRGADRAVSTLLDAGEWTVSLATGNWRRAAGLKLASASIPIGDPLPAGGFGEDGETRADVLRTALRRATEQSARTLERVVYVGDQMWDLAAARAAGVEFVGIATGGQRRALQDAGAPVLDDFDCVEVFLERIAGSQLPPRASAPQR